MYYPYFYNPEDYYRYCKKMYEKMYKGSNYRGISYAAWVHGNAAICESCLQNGIRTDVKGWGTKFTFSGEIGTKFWVHFNITTPVIMQDKKLELEKIFILFKILNSETPGVEVVGNEIIGSITNVHIYDGYVKIKEFNNLKLSGDHCGDIDKNNTFILEKPIHIRFGLGISVGVSLTSGPDIEGSILFTSVGADFI